MYFNFLGPYLAGMLNVIIRIMAFTIIIILLVEESKNGNFEIEILISIF